MIAQKIERPGPVGAGTEADLKAASFVPEHTAKHHDIATKAPTKPTRQEQWRKRNPKKVWAHVATQSAIRRGLLKRAACEVCGNQKSEAHHPDYDRPLVVEWLCRKHHRAEHYRAKAVPNV